MKRSKFFVAMVSLPLMAIALSGCVSVSPQMPRDSVAESTDFSGMDIMFAQMMIPHHEQAIDMSLIAESKGVNETVLELAREIKSEQQPEIDQMLSWLERTGSSKDMGHETHMSGMLSEEQMAELLNSTGNDFDRLFLEGMILHHEGAIEMAQMIVGSQNEEARLLADSIVGSQTIQIEQMRLLLDQLG